MAKIKIHTTTTLRRRVALSRERYQETGEHPNGVKYTSYKFRDETVELEGQLEIYVDMDKIVDHYAQVAFNNKKRRFVRGPIEVRVVNCAEVPGTRRTDTR